MTRDEAIAWQQKLTRMEPTCTLPGLCIKLRMGVNGSAEEWHAEDIAEHVALLEARLATWRPSSLAADAEFDAAVRHLVACTIRNVRAYPWWQMRTAKGV